LGGIVNFPSYFRLADIKTKCKELDEGTRRRIMMCYCKQWKKIKTKHDNLRKLGIDNFKAWEYANTRKGYWRISNSPILTLPFTNKSLKNSGYLSFTERYTQVTNF
jgi:hypothetical protein